MKRLLIAIMCLALCACGSGGEEDGVNQTQTPSQPSQQTIYADTTTLLTWQVSQPLPVTWIEAQTYCDTLQFADMTGWRLPTVKDLFTLIDYTTESPAITTPQMMSVATNTDTFWTSNISTENSLEAYKPNLALGYMYSETKTSPTSGALCVKGDPIKNPNFTNNFDGTIIDSNSSLEWQSVGPVDGLTWQEAINACDQLILAGHSDWRLPHIKEIVSSAVFQRGTAPLNNLFFSDTTLDNGFGKHYWSSTPSYTAGNAWYLRSQDGSIRWDVVTSLKYTRCVRTSTP